MGIGQGCEGGSVVMRLIIEALFLSLRWMTSLLQWVESPHDVVTTTDTDQEEKRLMT